MNRSGRLVIVIVVFCGVLIFAIPAYAYIDPGTGSMIANDLPHLLPYLHYFSVQRFAQKTTPNDA